VREHLIGYYVDAARRDGASWSRIGAVLGVTKQSAQTRYQPYGAAPNLVAVTTALTGRARQALDRAAVRAGRRDGSIGPGELLDGVLDDPDAMATVVLRAARLGIRKQASRSSETAGEDVSLSPEAGQALNLALREALGLGHNYVGTEHVMLGLAMLPEARLSAALARRHLDVEDLRRLAVEHLAAGPSSPTGGRRRRKTGTVSD